MSYVKCCIRVVDNPSIKDFADRQLPKESRFLRVVLKTFTFEATLVTAAKILVEMRADDVSGDEILDAMNRCDSQTSFRVLESGSDVTLESPDSRVFSMIQWADIVYLLQDQATTSKLLSYIEAFIRNAKPHRESVCLFIDLYRCYSRLAGRSVAEKTLTLREFGEQFIDHCDDPDDFITMWAMLEHCDDADDFRQHLLGIFPDEIFEWLYYEENHATSSEQIDDAISSAIEAAESLGLSEDDLDLTGAYQRLGELAEREDADANNREKELQLQRYELDRKATDDILDLLRE